MASKSELSSEVGTEKFIDLVTKSRSFSVTDVLKLSKAELTEIINNKGESCEGTDKAALQAKVLEVLGLSKNRVAVEDESNIDVEKVEFKKNLYSILGLVPEFTEERVESFFALFERIAMSYGWQKRFWSLPIQHKLKGKARDVFLALPYGLTEDYEFVKKRILVAYRKTPEYYRKAFREVKKSDSITYVEYVSKMERFLNNWLEAAEVYNFEQLKTLVLTENFQFQVPSADRLLVLKDAPYQAAAVLDDVALTRKQVVGGQQNFGAGYQSSYDGHQFRSRNHESNNQNGTKDKYLGHSKNNFHRQKLYCTVCATSGHTKDRCFKKGNK